MTRPARLLAPAALLVLLLACGGWVYAVFVPSRDLPAGEAARGGSSAGPSRRATSPSVPRHPSRASPAEEALAQERVAAARAAETAGDAPAAIRLYGQALATGPTASWSEARLALLRLGGPDPGEAAPEAERSFLLGRLDELDALLADAETPTQRFPLLLRDLWWRAEGATGRRPPALEGADPLTRARILWMGPGGGQGPYPEPAAEAPDPWPVLTALVQDRLLREGEGAAALPLDSPLWREHPWYDAWADWWTSWRDYVLGDVMAVGYHGLTPDHMRPEELEAQRAEDGRVARLRRRNLALGLGLVLAFVGLAGLLARRLGGRTRPPEA